MVFEGQAEIVDSLLKEIFEIVNPCGLEGTFVLLIRGYIDESYDIGKKLFLLSALVGTGHGFGWIDSDWKKCLDDRNGELISEGRKPMTRFHAAECNALDGEYKGWTRPEQIKFMQNLIKVLGKAELDSVAFALDLGPYFKFFPEQQELSQAELLSNLYGVMTKFVVYNLAPQYVAADPSVRISLIYDHSEYDGVMADAFRKAIQDENFRDRSCYTSITPASSVDVRPLQMADLVAHENFKEAKRSYRTEGGHTPKRRNSLKAMIKQGNFGGGIEYISTEALRDLKWILSRNQNG